jgi:uncharacterized membrane protein YfcA
MTNALAAAAIGLAAGVLSGLFGVGGGILFVPALTLLLGLSQLDAEATSLAAIIPVVLAGVWRQRAYGNVRTRPALTIGIASVLLVVVAGQMLWSLRSPRRALAQGARRGSRG